MQAGKQQQPNPVEVLAGLVDQMTPDRMIEILSYLKGIASVSSLIMNFLLRHVLFAFVGGAELVSTELLRASKKRHPRETIPANVYSVNPQFKTLFPNGYSLRLCLTLFPPSGMTGLHEHLSSS